MHLARLKNRFNIIYADPPWTYRDKAHAGKRGVEYKYPCLTLDELCGLPVKNICKEDCALFLWVTPPMIPYSFQLIEAWGFAYKTVAFTWVKCNKGKYAWGMGSYTRANPEYCLLGVRGKLKRESASVHSIIESPREEHSKKPDIVRDKIVQLFGDISRIELFARKKVPGWQVWGSEV